MKKHTILLHFKNNNEIPAENLKNLIFLKYQMRPNNAYLSGHFSDTEECLAKSILKK